VPEMAAQAEPEVHTDTGEELSEEVAKPSFSNENIERAIRDFGMDLSQVHQFSSEDDLVRAMNLSAQARQVQQPDAQQEQAEQTEEEQSYLAKFGKLEPLQEGEYEADYIEREQTFRGAIQELASQVEELRSHATQASQQEQQAVQAQFIADFESALKKVGDAELYGDGDYSALQDGTPQYKNVSNTFNRVLVEMDIAHRSGEKLPTMEEVVRRADRALFADHYETKTKSATRKELIEQATNRTGNPARSEPLTMGPPSRTNDPLTDPQLDAAYQHLVKQGIVDDQGAI